MKCYMNGQSYKSNPYTEKSYSCKFYTVSNHHNSQGLSEQGNIWKFLKELIFHLPMNYGHTENYLSNV
jgi:hypothetical protein